MYVIRITSEAELERLRPQWNRLSRGVPFRTWQWLHPWWRHYSEGRDLYVLAVYDDNHVLRGVASWFREKTLRNGRILRGLGTGEVCSDYLSLLTELEHTEQVTVAIAHWLTEAARGPSPGNVDHCWDLLELTGVNAKDYTIRQLISHLHQYGHVVYCQEDSEDLWPIELPATWDAYLARMSKSHRKKTRKLHRELASSDILVHWASTPEEYQIGIQVFIDLHQRRWQALGEAGCFSSQPFLRFICESAICLAADNQLRLYWIEWQGEPVAAEFQLVGDSAIYAYQSGLNPDRLNLSPGKLANIIGIRKAISEGKKQYNFLRGNHPYKKQWRAEPRASLFARIVPPKPLALTRYAAWVATRWTKDILKNKLAGSSIRRRIDIK